MEVVEEHKLKTTLRVAGGWVRDKVILIIVLNGYRSWEKRAVILISH